MSRQRTTRFPISSEYRVTNVRLVVSYRVTSRDIDDRSTKLRFKRMSPAQDDADLNHPCSGQLGADC